MLNTVNHAKNLWSSNYLTDMVNSTKTKSLHRAFLTCRTTDDASNLFDSEFLFCHILDSYINR